MSLPSHTDSFAAWYAAVVRDAELAEHAPVRGAMVIKPYGYAIWERIQAALDERIKATGHQNMYFPMLFPEALLEREREMVEGFAPEVLTVTEAGGRPLEERLVVRPTSEAVIWSAYAGWVQSYRDLPLLYNQWGNAVRWEMRPRLFLRTTEFLWQEGHTAHETADEAIAEARMVLDEVYRDVAVRVLAMPVWAGRKSASERFPGALETFTIEALMRDGRALQSATAHYLGDTFARAFGVEFTDREGVRRHPFAASWGAATRLVGGIVMTHGDHRGLRLPPAIAPHQVVVVPIGDAGEAAAASARQLAAGGVRVHLDERSHLRPGAKYYEWELKGVPVRLELGPRDLAAGTVSLVRRDTGARETVAAEAGLRRVLELLDEIQAELHDDARRFRDRRTARPGSREELLERLGAGDAAVAPWCGDAACETAVREASSATIRWLPLDPDPPAGERCIVCGAPAAEWATWAKAY